MLRRPSAQRSTGRVSWAVGAAVLATVVALTSLPAAAAPRGEPPPTLPSDSASVPSGSTRSPSGSAPSSAGSAPGAATQAQAAANDADRRVASLTASVRAADRSLAAATRAADRAQAAYTAAVATDHAAALAARRAGTAATLAGARYASDHALLLSVVTAAYQQGGSVADVATLLSAGDPARLISTADVSESIAQYRADVVARDVRSSRAAATTQARLVAALATAVMARSRTRTVADSAGRAQTAAVIALRSLRRQLAAAKVSRQDAVAVLSTFLGGWSAADPALADALDRRYLALARTRSARPLAASGTGWTAAQGESVVWRTLMWIGTPYAWAGGDARGPTAGVCAGGGAQNDCHVTGFDCSGLVLYAWAPYLALPHLAATQYLVAGREHPDAAHLLAGDLVFWSSNGTVSGIHHVALYVGGGDVLQAPQSGDIVRVTPLADVDSGYFGATRPRT